MGIETQNAPTGSERAKLCAAEAAVAEISDNMKIGLGSGSTAELMIKCLAMRAAREKMQLSCIATSERSARLARENGLSIATLDEVAPLDLVIDGADEFDPGFTLIKGGGGAHLREKIVAINATRLLVIADISKQVTYLGKFPLPVEIIPLGHKMTCAHIAKTLDALGYGQTRITQRMQNTPQDHPKAAPFISDEGNYIYDLHLERIKCAKTLNQTLLLIAGVVETGLFIDICTQIIVGFDDGRTKNLHKNRAP